MMRTVAPAVAFDDERVGPLFDRVGWRVASAEVITSLRLSGSRRFAYRVTLADGRTVKLRRLNRRGARAFEIVQALPDGRFARVLHVEDDLVIEEWIEGVVLAARPARREHVEGAAAILAALHRAGAVHGRTEGDREAPTRVVEATLARLHLLGSEDLLTAGAAAGLAETVRRCAPATAPVGLTHNDFCGDNMVVDATGALRIIDNEGMAIGFVDYDLARTWYRWSLDGPLWEAFGESYRAAGGPTPDPCAAAFWRIAALAKSAEVRRRGTPSHLEAALVTLRRLDG